MNYHGRVAFLPFGPIILTGQRLKPYHDPPQTLGDHLKKKRIVSGWMQREVAAKLEVTVWTYGFWENDVTFPVIRNLQKIIKYLGYYPFNEPQTAGERVLAGRRRLGLSQEKLAQLLNVGESIIEKAERSPCRSSQSILVKTQSLLDHGELTTE